MANKEETFLLVSLEEDKAKKLAQVISNDTCRKILDHLSAKKATETELSQQLNIPISTVHYNLKHLVDNKLVEAEEFHYSEKGKEVLHYSLSNKYVIIAPKGASDKFMDKLKSMIGAIATIGFIGLAIEYLPKMFGVVSMGAAKSSVAESASRQMLTAGPLMAESASAAQASDMAYGAAYSQAASNTLPVIFWVLVGAVSCIILYLIFEYFRKRSKK